MLSRYNSNSVIAAQVQMCLYTAGPEKKIAFTMSQETGIFLVDDQAVPSTEQYLSGLPGYCHG